MKTRSIFILKKIYRLIACLTSIATVFGVYFLSQEPLFKGYVDSFEISLYENSSCAEFINVDKIDYKFVFNKTGESCEIIASEKTVEEILEDFSAELLFVEKTEEQISYYAISDKIKYRKIIDGVAVNLHVSVSKDRIKIGAPVIFGSF